MLVAVPEIAGPGALVARAWQDPLVPGAHGIPTSLGPVVSQVDVCICPGLAFDRAGGRLGYGGGYYDAWLDRVRPFAVALAVPEALVDRVPVEPHDVRVDAVVTPDEVVYTMSHRGENDGFTIR